MSLDKALPARLSTKLGFLISSILVFLFIQKDSIAGPFAYVPGRYSWGGPLINKIDLNNNYKIIEMRIKAAPDSIYLHPNGNLAYLSARNMDDENNDRIHNTSILDTKTGKYLQRFETTSVPIGINFQAKELYFSKYKSLIVLDLLDYSIKNEYALNGSPLLVIYNKHQLAGQLRILYFDIGESRHGIFDTTTNSVTYFETEYNVDQAVDRQMKKIFFSGFSGKVYVVDVDNNKLVSTIDIGGLPQGGIAASTNSDEVFVATSESKNNSIAEIVVLDSMTGSITRRFRIPGNSTITHINTTEYFPDDLYIATQEQFLILDKKSGAVKYTLSNLNGSIWTGFLPSFGTYVLDAPKDQIDSDRLFNWAEDKYPEIFSSPQRPFSETADGYYFRYYPGTDTYLGAKGGNVFYLPAGAGMNEIIDLGLMDKFLPNADADGY
ncbi:MAG: hypothetical protein WC091_05625 [Sulfuricellaceae bacterium]